MKRIVTACMVLGLMAWASGWVHAAVLIDDNTAGGTQNGMRNGNLDVPGNPPCCDSDLADFWTVNEFRTNSGPTSTASFASFGNHTPGPTPPGSTEQQGWWLHSFAGTFADPANADLYQDNPGTPGMKYILTGWARFEGFFSGGQVLSPTFDPVTGQFILLPSPTDMVFAIDFLDSGGTRIGGVSQDLFTDPNGPQINGMPYKQHMVMATAPLGTVTVRARASMIEGVSTFGGQSAFVDDFTLISVPEPTTIALVGLGLVGLVGIRRRSK